MDVFALFDSISILVVGVIWQWSSEARILNPVMGVPIVSGGELRYHAKLSPSIHILTLNHSVMSNARVVLPVPEACIKKDKTSPVTNILVNHFSLINENFSPSSMNIILPSVI